MLLLTCCRCLLLTRFYQRKHIFEPKNGLERATAAGKDGHIKYSRPLLIYFNLLSLHLPSERGCVNACARVLREADTHIESRAPRLPPGPPYCSRSAFKWKKEDAVNKL